MRLGDLLDLDVLREHINAGYVTERLHPGGWDDEALCLRVLNYTSKAQYERVWDDVTRQCRGLIYREEPDREVVARPWPKFYNYGEHEVQNDYAIGLPLNETVEVTDKLDGSLGILYPTGDGYAVATRGSFESDQALHATAVWRERYSTFEPRPTWTYLFEIVYPENRIVVDYAGRDDLVLLGAVNTSTGHVLGPGADPDWPGPRADVMHDGGFPVVTLRDALRLGPRSNAEGLVVRYLNSGTMVKIKQDDYVVLHRIVTGLNERTVWERMGAGETVEQIAENLPDEFRAWVEDVAVGLNFRADHVYYDVREAYERISATLNNPLAPVPENDRQYRKWFAGAARDRPDISSLLFLMLDDKDLRPAIWRSIKPEGGRSPREFSEVTA